MATYNRNDVRQRFAGGMLPSQAIAGRRQADDSLLPLQFRSDAAPREWGSPLRTQGSTVNFWGGDATKAGNRWYSAPPPDAPQARPAAPAWGGLVNPTYGSQANLAQMPTLRNRLTQMVPSATQEQLFGNPERFAAYQSRLGANRARGMANARASAMQDADDRRLRLAARAGNMNVPQQAFVREVRGGGGMTPLVAALAGQPGLAGAMYNADAEAQSRMAVAGARAASDMDMLREQARMAVLTEPGLPEETRQEMLAGINSASGIGAGVREGSPLTPQGIRKEDYAGTWSEFRKKAAFAGVPASQARKMWEQVNPSRPSLVDSWISGLSDWGKNLLGSGLAQQMESPWYGGAAREFAEPAAGPAERLRRARESGWRPGRPNPLTGG